MSIATTARRIQYTLSSTNQALSFPYYFLANSDLVVVKTDPITLLDTPLVITTNYTITGAGVGAGGTVTMVGATVGDIITIYGAMPQTQPVALPFQGQLPSAAIEQAYDRLTMLVQQLKLDSDRALRLPITRPAPTPFPMATRAGKLVGFNDEGDFDLFDATTGVPISMPVSVLSYGADPTGIADSLDAFKAAAAASNNVYIPDGIYKLTVLSAGFTFSRSTNWTGQSKAGTILRLYNTPGVYVNFFNITGDGVQFSNFTIQNYTTGVLCSMFGIQNGDNFILDNLSVDGRMLSGSQIYLLSIYDTAVANYGRISNCDIKGLQIGVWTQTTLDTTITGWRFENNYWSGNFGSALELHTASTSATKGWRNVTITGNIFANPGTSASFYSLGSVSLANVRGCAISGNVFHDHDTALDQYAAQAVHLENNCYNVAIVGNSFPGCKNPIVITTAVFSTTISGNTFQYAAVAYTASTALSNKAAAIQAFDEPINHLVITDNIIINYERGAGISFTEADSIFSRNVIKGCYIGTIGTHGPNCADNIYKNCFYAINAFGTSQRNVVVGHNTYDNCNNLFLQSAGDRLNFPRGLTIRGVTGSVAAGSSFISPLINPAVLLGSVSVELVAVDGTGNALSAGSTLSQTGATVVETGLITQANAGITATGHSSAAGSLKFTFNNGGATRTFSWIWTLNGGMTIAF